jgi:hypothetical protein
VTDESSPRGSPASVNSRTFCPVGISTANGRAVATAGAARSKREYMRTPVAGARLFLPRLPPVLSRPRPTFVARATCRRSVKELPRPRRLCFEEGAQSAWLYEALSPHVDELVVVGAKGNRGQKNDALDALALAQGLRVGNIETRVYKAPTRFSRLRSLARAFDQLTRVKLRRG